MITIQAALIMIPERGSIGRCLLPVIILGIFISLYLILHQPEYSTIVSSVITGEDGITNSSLYGEMPNAIFGKHTALDEFDSTSELITRVSSLQPNCPVSEVEFQTQKSLPTAAQQDIYKSSSLPRVQVVIVTTKRSGSSFIGELFNSNPLIFYTFEPLSCITFDVLHHHLLSQNAMKESLNIWNHILRCNYSTVYPKPTKWVATERINMCGKSNALNRSSLLCGRPSAPLEKVGHVISELCLAHSFTVLKTIRVMDIKELRSFFEDETLNMKVLHLIRDPRAVMNSRWKLKEENSDLLQRKGKGADEILDLCQHMARNLKYREDPPSWLKGRYIMVRFEDIASNPVEETRRIYSELGLPIHQDVIDWIEQNTVNSPKMGSPFSHQRNTSAVLTAWKYSIPTWMRKDVERKCRYVMSSLLTEGILMNFWHILTDLTWQHISHDCGVPCMHMCSECKIL